jgi:hypothetical protein
MLEVVKYVSSSICHKGFHQLISNEYVEQMHTCIGCLLRHSMLSQSE